MKKKHISDIYENQLKIYEMVWEELTGTSVKVVELYLPIIRRNVIKYPYEKTSKYTKETGNRMIKNSERMYANISLVIFILGVIGCILPFIKDMDMMNGGFALVIISGFVTVLSFIFFLIFNKSANVKSKIINTEDIIGRWNLSSEEVKKNKQEVEEYITVSKIGSSVIGIIIFLIGLIVFLIDIEENGLFFVIMAGSALFIVGTVFLISKIRYKRIINEQANVTFTSNGMCYKGDIYVWDGIATKLESVFIDPESKNDLIIIFTQLKGRTLTRGRSMFRIPISKDMYNEAEKVVAAYNLNPDGEMLDYLRENHDIFD